MSKKTITVPSQINANSLSETFGKISFSKDMNDILSALRAEIVIRYHPGSSKPTISVVDHKDNLVCTLDELKAISGCRRFALEALKDADRAAAKNEKVELLAFFLRTASAENFTISDRMVEGNLTKFNQFGRNIQAVEHNLEKIDETIDNSWKKYLQEKGKNLIQVFIGGQLKCVEPTVLDKDWIDKQLVNANIPKWVYRKFLDKNFTNNLKSDCLTLLFPKNNYLKSITMTTKELHHEPFMTANQAVLKNSGSVIAMAKTDFAFLFDAIPDTISDQASEVIDNFEWILQNPYSIAEILAVRETGKQVPIFKEQFLSNKMLNESSMKTKLGNRKPSDIATFKAQVANRLGLLQATWIGINNFVLPINNPITGWWMHLFPNADKWNITPTKNLYQHILEEPNHESTLNKIHGCSDEKVLKLSSDITAIAMRISENSSDKKVLDDMFKNFLNKSLFKQIEKATYSVDIDHPIRDIWELIERQPPTAEEKALARNFLGMSKKPSNSKKKRVGGAATRIRKEAVDELFLIKKEPYYGPVKDWLMTTFKTGKVGAMQQLAASRIAGEFMKFANDIFEDYNEDEAVEDYDSDDDDY